jgi:hypothetical protein
MEILKTPTTQGSSIAATPMISRWAGPGHDKKQKKSRRKSRYSYKPSTWNYQQEKH